MQKRHGFTLVELLVVIAIIAILASIILVSYQGAMKAANKSKCEEMIKNIEMAISLYHKAYKEYPPSSDNFDSDGKWLGEIQSNKNSLFKFLCGEQSEKIRGYALTSYLTPDKVDSDGRILDTYGNPIRYQNNIEDRKKKGKPYTQEFILRSFGENATDDSGLEDDLGNYKNFDVGK